MSDEQNHRRTKVENLAQEGTLNPASGKVRDLKFQEGGFFDPRDVVQVKYELLRRVSVEEASVTDASDDFGVSRPTFYQAKSDFDDAGIVGLVPKKRGPRGPNKLQGEILAFIKERISPGSRSERASWSPWSGTSSAWMCIQERSNARSVEKKRRDEPGQSMPASFPHILQAQYEMMRAAALGEERAAEARRGLTVLLRRGMWSWTRVITQGQTPQGVIAPFAPQPSRSNQFHDRRAVIHVLAALAMTLSDRRTA